MKVADGNYQGLCTSSFEIGKGVLLTVALGAGIVPRVAARCMACSERLRGAAEPHCRGGQGSGLTLPARGGYGAETAQGRRVRRIVSVFVLKFLRW